MAKLIDAAEMLQDMYYQNYRTDEDFFTLEHFVYVCSMVYSKILEEEYKLAKRESRQEEGMTNVVINGDYLITEKVKPVKKDGDYVLKLKNRLFSFPYDKYSFAVQRITNPKRGCRKFVRTNAVKSDWIGDILPKSDRVFYFGQGNEIVLRNVSCVLDTELIILYVPDYSETDPQEAIIPENKGYEVVSIGLELMKRARSGEVVDMTNNSNPNKVIQTEMDNVFTNLRTKPV